MPTQIGPINRYVLANVAYRPVSTLLSVLAIAVEVTMILTLVGLSYGTLDATARRTRGVGADIIVRQPGASVIGLSTAPMTDRLLAVLMKQPHVTLATGTVVQPLAGLDTITGLDLPSFDKMSGGFHFLEGGPFRADNDILVDEYYAKEHRLRVGDTVHLINRDWRLAGIFESGKLTRIAVRLPALQELTGNPNHLSQIFIKVDDSQNIGTVVEGFARLLPGYAFYPLEELPSM